jgi:uncharacterized surface anchored protein
VTVDPFDVSAPRSGSSDANGVALFGRVGQGPATVTVSVAGYVFDDSLTNAVPVQKDLVADVTAYGYRASTVAVTVHDPDGPVAAATVSLTDAHGVVRTSTTDASGAAPTFTNLLPGSYSLDVSDATRRAEQSSVVIANGGTTVTRDVMLPAYVPPGTLRVSTRDATTLQALSGVTLTMVNSQGKAVAGSPTSTVSGQASWASLAPGTYTLSASKTGYVSVTGKTVTVVSGQPSDLTIDLATVASQTGTIRAVVKDSRDKLVKNQWVYIRYPDGRQFSSKTGSDGTVEWSGLAIGSYTLWLDGHAGATQSATPSTPYTVLTFVT